MLTELTQDNMHGRVKRQHVREGNLNTHIDAAFVKASKLVCLKLCCVQCVHLEELSCKVELQALPKVPNKLAS